MLRFSLMLISITLYSTVKAQSLGDVNLSRFVYGDNSTKTSIFTDPNGLYNSGFYNNSTGTNMPYNTWWHLIINRHTNEGNNYQFQLAADFWGDNTYFRKITGGYAQSWRRILNDGQDIYASNMNQYLRSTDNVNFNSLNVSQNVGIGTTTPTEKLSVNGNIRAKKIIVTQTGWPDFVFEPGYSLTSLFQLEKYIKNNHHLPEVNTAEEIEKNGLDIGENQKVLMKKIEELTLYVIELKNEIELIKNKKK